MASTEDPRKRKRNNNLCFEECVVSKIEEKKTGFISPTRSNCTYENRITKQADQNGSWKFVSIFF